MLMVYLIFNIHANFDNKLMVQEGDIDVGRLTLRLKKEDSQHPIKLREFFFLFMGSILFKLCMLGSN